VTNVVTPRGRRTPPRWASTPSSDALRRPAGPAPPTTPPPRRRAPSRHGPLARSCVSGDPSPPATLGQRQAEGLLALASATITDDADPDRATVVAIVELAAICDDDPQATAELETGQPLATDTARRLICDCRLSVLVQDMEGRAVGLGTTARTVTPALRRALMVRDGHCRFGDCTSRRFLHGHHIDHWPAPTVMSNLALVCYQHHHALHEGGWTLTGDPDGQLIAVHPDGRRSPPNQPRTLDDTS